jgi:hypothetical protein
MAVFAHLAPLFGRYSSRLSKAAANFVDVIHTSGSRFYDSPLKPKKFSECF